MNSPREWIEPTPEEEAVLEQDLEDRGYELLMIFPNKNDLAFLHTKRVLQKISSSYNIVHMRDGSVKLWVKPEQINELDEALTTANTALLRLMREGFEDS